MTAIRISDTDRKLIDELKSKIQYELELVPSYSDDLSLLRWLVGWDRKVDVIVPKIRFSLRAIHALGLHKEDLSTLDKVTAKCDECSKPLQYLPGSLLGFDKEGNVISLQMIGRLDVAGLMPCTRNSDLYRMRIAESEGVMQIIRAREKEFGKQLGTSVIFDLDGLSMSQLDVQAMKVVTTMLAQLQEMFPDVIRKVFVINAPSFIQLLWGMVSPCLAKQTQQKIKILGENWRDVLRESIGEDVLYENWGGTRKSETPFGHVRTGGKVPVDLRYDSSSDLPADKLQKLVVSARSMDFVPVEVEGFESGRKITWWWRLDSNDIGFAVYRAAPGREKVAEHTDDFMAHPKFRLQTDFVPEDGEILAEEPGVYKFVFDNTHSKLRSKTVKYYIDVKTDLR
ncbi:CRAL/TRIO domain protein [Teladorsagia circumcincta]|uniref:CRAL/TRIO domain protein n=1 Tax=Teladorsagia circumcincta TaxID=45464 RepID=A0A2G9V211_TELCI|nr:CRAL/TRIO domain protein [Teladorsagia circumcincta]